MSRYLPRIDAITDLLLPECHKKPPFARTGECPQNASIAAIAAGEREIGEQFWNALIDGAVVATGGRSSRSHPASAR
jgi:hypothetical protein